jgi:D-3-phosphoglycerate dehydrogenase
MKDGVYIINAARGGCVDRFDLEEAVNSGKVAGAGLDVHEEEPPGKDYNLIDVEEVILAPHLGGTTVAAMDNVALEAAKQALMVFNDELPRTPLNVPRLQPEELKQVQPYINLAEKLGGFYAGWESSRIKEVEVIYRGEIANKETELVTPAVLKGLLDPVVEEELNLVNADVFAEKRGIKVVETTSSSSDEFANLVTLKINDGETTKQLSGTIFHNEGIRIVDIDGYDVDVIPEGNLLVTAHSDQPGIVGKVGTLLGNNDINIASMQLGRNQAGGKAIMIINIDQQLDEQLTEDLLEIDGMNDFSLLNL